MKYNISLTKNNYNVNDCDCVCVCVCVCGCMRACAKRAFGVIEIASSKNYKIPA